MKDKIIELQDQYINLLGEALNEAGYEPSEEIIQKETELRLEINKLEI